ncbi:ATP-binding cassette domain-containing protein [Sphingomonas sp. LR61]|uniref:ATP-binding cassette domain-containing protein n=1 Tax=Sphingomonas sp. LR61 TaxID=3050234 RepID=UPI002FE0B0D8
MGAFTATDLTLYLGGPQPVLNALSTTIANSAVTAVVGPNACGKSTLLRTFARILTEAPAR